MIYFDNAATTLQKPPVVRSAVDHALRECASPGRGGHAASLRASETLLQLRQQAAKLFDAETEQVVLTMNATHGLNLAIRTLVRPGARVLVSGFEHNAVMRPLAALRAIPVVASRALFAPERTVEDFSTALRTRPAAVIVNHVSNVYGYVQPLEQLAALCASMDIPLIVDASQSAGVQPLSFRRLGASFLAMPGHKSLYGPQGTGLLICGRLPGPLLQGGTGSLSEQLQMPDFLPDRAEAGTQNVPGAAGLLAGMRFIEKLGTKRIAAGEEALRARICSGLAGVSGVRVYDGGKVQSGVVSFLIEGVDCETAAARYAARGVALRAGLHCAPLAHESGGTRQSGTLRVSFSAFNTQRQAEEFLQFTEEIVKKA